MQTAHGKKFILFVPDGAADLYHLDGLSSLAMARTPHADFVARAEVSGLKQTFYPDLPSQLGDLALKIRFLEAFDRDVVGPVIGWFRERPEQLGGVMSAPESVLA